MNLASEKVWKTKSVVWGGRGAEERKEGMPFKNLLYMVSGALWT